MSSKISNNHLGPKHLYRSSDAERFTRDENGMYTMDRSEMYNKYRYTWETLKAYGFVGRKRDCVLEEYIPEKYDGHGYEEDESC
jgi:hypothetical protein